MCSVFKLKIKTLWRQMTQRVSVLERNRDWPDGEGEGGVWREKSGHTPGNAPPCSPPWGSGAPSATTGALPLRQEVAGQSSSLKWPSLVSRPRCKTANVVKFLSSHGNSKPMGAPRHPWKDLSVEKQMKSNHPTAVWHPCKHSAVGDLGLEFQKNKYGSDG